MLKFVACTALALTGAVLVATDPASSAAGIRGLPGSRISIPFIIRRNARAGLLRAPRFAFARAPFGQPQARFFAPRTTTPLHPFAHLTRRYHRLYWAGWTFPVTFGDEPYDPGFIGAPYDPAETIPVYGPAPSADAAARPPVAADAAAQSRDACRSERVTVPSGDNGERIITVVRC